jgi:Domain of unknown function (DUF4258)
VNIRKRPEQISDLKAKILECIEQERYIQSKHSIDRKAEREIELPDILYVLKTGYHEKKKTRFDEIYQAWNYAVRGNTVEGLDIRIIVAFSQDGMLMITVMHVTKYHQI